MTLSCTLFGHKYGEEEVEERKEEQDGKMAIVEVSKKTCNRCGDQREEKMRTRIVENGESEDSETNQQSSTSDSRGTSRRSDNPSTGLGTSKKDYIDDEADGGVILTDTDDNSQSGNQDSSSTTSESETEIGFTEGDATERTVKDDEGVVVLGQDEQEQDGSETDNNFVQDEETTEYRIVCESCTYTDVDVETSRRDGDLCPECGGWLEVKQITDTEPHSEE